jgi:hypothetical protein
VAAQWIGDRRTVWERQLDRLGEVLAEPEINDSLERK